jgi:RimJ/RimL family protein N-acetyltransferase
MVRDKDLGGGWARPELSGLEGRHVTIARVAPDADVADLYELSHRTEEFRALWTYMFNGPFADQEAMHRWLVSIKESRDPIFFTVHSRELRRRVGIFSLLNIVPEMGRLELGNIWYSPIVQRTQVNTEVTYLFLRYVLDELGYRRVEWKCDDRNEPSKRAALRMGFKYEGLFRKHMVVKGQNRDTAWFSIIDEEWPTLRERFERYLAGEAPSLTELNRERSRA